MCMFSKSYMYFTTDFKITLKKVSSEKLKMVKIHNYTTNLMLYLSSKKINKILLFCYIVYTICVKIHLNKRKGVKYRDLSLVLKTFKM